jgi:AcrR family transcriptional regulator
MVVTYVSAVDRKEQLINATIAVLQKSGIKGVTTRSVAAEANAPLASIHYTFGSLDDLVLAAWVADGLDVKAGYGPCIIGIMERVAGLLEDERYGVLLHDLNPTGDRRVEILEEKYYRLARDLIDLIADAVGHEPAIPRPQLARMTMAAIDGVVLQFAANNDIKIARSDLAQFGLVLANAAERRL